jgi:hypothetical protein
MSLAILLAALLLAALGAPAQAGDTTSEFLRHHWRQPLSAQGAAPPGFSPLEASLEPAACGTCHPVQYGDWRQSTHAAASGPGVAGQLVEMWRRDPAAASGCYACHAPLAEQRPFVRRPAGFEPNPAFVASLAGQGVPCAACHVRGHQRFGPPRRDGSLASRVARATLPHNGLTRTPAFLSAQFCRGCHQFEPNGPSLGGTLLQDTYNEWQASRFARAGVQCQDCHMPDRRHRWRGIHDPEMVRSGLTISARADAEGYRPGDWASLRLTVTSTRIGHAFPTYVTPRVVLRIEVIDRAGQVVAGSRTERIIAREVALDLSRQYFDTRLKPGDTAMLAYRPLRCGGLRARSRSRRARGVHVLLRGPLRQGAGSGETDQGSAGGRATTVRSLRPGQHPVIPSARGSDRRGARRRRRIARHGPSVAQQRPPARRDRGASATRRRRADSASPGAEARCPAPGAPGASAGPRLRPGDPRPSIMRATRAAGPGAVPRRPSFRPGTAAPTRRTMIRCARSACVGPTGSGAWDRARSAAVCNSTPVSLATTPSRTRGRGSDERTALPSASAATMAMTPSTGGHQRRAPRPARARRSESRQCSTGTGTTVGSVR